MRARTVAFVVLALLVPSLALAQVAPKVDPDAPTITTRADRSKVQLGEPFHLLITVLHKPDMNVELPATLEVGEGFAEMAARENTRSVEKDGLVKRTFTLTLGALETGTQTVPGIALASNWRAASNCLGSRAVSTSTGGHW